MLRECREISADHGLNLPTRRARTCPPGFPWMDQAAKRAGSPFGPAAQVHGTWYKCQWAFLLLEPRYTRLTCRTFYFVAMT